MNEHGKRERSASPLLRSPNGGNGGKTPEIRDAGDKSPLREERFSFLVEPYEQVHHDRRTQVVANPIVARDIVTQHYNQRPRGELLDRHQSPIITIKNFNNWIKSVLLCLFVRRDYRVLDFCCGKGGDLLKWKAQKVQYVLGLDVAENSIDEYRHRYSDMSRRFRPFGRERDDPTVANLVVECFTLDCFRISVDMIFDGLEHYPTTPMAPLVPRNTVYSTSAYKKEKKDSLPLDLSSGSKEVPASPGKEIGHKSPVAREPVKASTAKAASDHRFHVISCQFALHYAFESEARASKCFENAAASVIKGGYFIGTIPNAERLLELLKQHPDERNFGNSVYSVQFGVTYDELVSQNALNAFGTQYSFYLMDAIDDCPEYLVTRKNLVNVAAKHGFRLLFLVPFYQFYLDHCIIPTHGLLLRSMHALGPNGFLTHDEWDVTDLYCTFAFEKMSDESIEIDEES